MSAAATEPACDGALTPPAPRPRLLISACLLGRNVRFDGGHKQDRSLLGSLGKHVDFVGLCPEMEAGMGAPRESVRQVREDGATRIVAPKSGRDWTADLAAASAVHAERYSRGDVDGVVLKKDSPTCGMERVRVYGKGGVPSRDGVGVLARALIEAQPLLPAEEEGRLRDPRLREHFIDRIFTLARFRAALESDPTPAGLVRFHTLHKFTVLAHSPARYRELGRIAAASGALPWPTLFQAYRGKLLEALDEQSTPGRHVNVLQHLAGHVKRELSAGDKSELNDVLENYRSGHVPLVVPLVLLLHHLRRHPPAEWARAQVYLEPYPRDLVLRNQI